MFMQKLNETLLDEFNTSVTENGAVGYRTTGKELLDLNFSVTSLRNASEDDICNRFAKAFCEDKLLAMKWLFFARDVREGLGERRLFRVCMEYLTEVDINIVKALIPLVPEYGRWDDLWCLLETEAKDDVITLVTFQLTQDLLMMADNKPCSLLAKWLPSINTSSTNTRKFAKIICKELYNGDEQTYRIALSTLRKYLKVVEVSMSAQEWEAIEYSAVPSRANLLYSDAFLTHDYARRQAFLDSLQRGETKINAGVLFPHDIVYKYFVNRQVGVDVTLEELWKALPDLVQGNGTTICVADGSGSMQSRVGNSGVTALDVANGLALYFAERCSGEFKDKYITFSTRPQLVDLSNCETLRDKLRKARAYNEVANTNIEAVFDLILITAVKNNMTQEELPSNILILSDMEFDACAQSNDDWGSTVDARLFDVIATRYRVHGYELPRLIFWNICSRTNTIPVRENECGVALVSGFSPNVVKMVMSGSTDPFECLLEQLNSDRYKAVEEVLKTILP